MKKKGEEVGTYQEQEGQPDADEPEEAKRWETMIFGKIVHKMKLEKEQ